MEGLWRGGGLERRGRGGPLTGAARAVRQAVEKPRSPLGYTPALASLPAGARQRLGSLGWGGLSLNTTRPEGARAPGSAYVLTTVKVLGWRLP